MDKLLIFGGVLVLLAGLVGLAIVVAGAFLNESAADPLSASDGAEAERPDLVGGALPVLREATHGHDDWERQARALRRLR